ncbi:MAG: acetamidase/formamidase family protein [Bacillota bacterium]|nr:acetamidase/formamidase family protein [Bacillota bacterium]
MMIKVTSETCIYRFSKDNKPAASVESGETVIFETLDCFGNQIQSNDDKLETMDWNRVNPATGPVYVNGAEPGDVLKVTIQRITCRNKGVIATGENFGVLGDKFKGLVSRVVPIKDDMAVFDEKLSLPLNRMIGVIGVAPEGEALNTGTPGHHGGNMDNTRITENAVLYLPVAVPGALFALGDLHAVMGDGEISGTGLEVAGEVQVQLEVIKGLKLNNPVLENENFYAAIASAATLDEAVSASVSDMFDIAASRIELPDTEITMLFSLAGQTQICQVVDPLKTARFVIPKCVLEKYNFKFV